MEIHLDDISQSRIVQEYKISHTLGHIPTLDIELSNKIDDYNSDLSLLLANNTIFKGRIVNAEKRNGRYKYKCESYIEENEIYQSLEDSAVNNFDISNTKEFISKFNHIYCISRTSELLKTEDAYKPRINIDSNTIMNLYSLRNVPLVHKAIEIITSYRYNKLKRIINTNMKVHDPRDEMHYFNDFVLTSDERNIKILHHECRMDGDIMIVPELEVEAVFDIEEVEVITISTGKGYTEKEIIKERLALYSALIEKTGRIKYNYQEKDKYAYSGYFGQSTTRRKIPFILNTSKCFIANVYGGEFVSFYADKILNEYKLLFDTEIEIKVHGINQSINVYNKIIIDIEGKTYTGYVYHYTINSDNTMHITIRLCVNRESICTEKKEIVIQEGILKEKCTISESISSKFSVHAITNSKDDVSELCDVILELSGSITNHENNNKGKVYCRRMSGEYIILKCNIELSIYDSSIILDNN